MQDFTKALSDVDSLLLFDVYSAGEKLIEQADSMTLSKHIQAYGKITPCLISPKEISKRIKNHLTR